MIVQNSFPKGGARYTGANGKNYVYAIFWTRVTNTTSEPLELAIDFPQDPFEFPSSSGNYFRLLLPSDSMTTAKIPLFDFGLDLNAFLDLGIHSSHSLLRAIQPNDASGFYVVTLSTRGIDGVLRTGLQIKGQRLFYSINDTLFECGKINLKDLQLRE